MHFLLQGKKVDVKKKKKWASQRKNEMARRDAGTPGTDVFKYLICKLSSKEDEVGSPLTPTAKCEVQG